MSFNKTKLFPKNWNYYIIINFIKDKERNYTWYNTDFFSITVQRKSVVRITLERNSVISFLLLVELKNQAIL